MHFIVYDLEMNQGDASLYTPEINHSCFPLEIIQIGAIKLDSGLNTIGTFNRYVKPTFFPEINPFITVLTGITTEQLRYEDTFPEIFKAFIKFIDLEDPIFCIWGMSDMKVLFKNAECYQLNHDLLPKMVIDLQPYIQTYLKLPRRNMPRLQHIVEKLNIPISCSFHNAFNDAFYTAEVFKKVYNSTIQPKQYDFLSKISKPKDPKRIIDTEKLWKQFEKMYARILTDEEKQMILLAYKMGRTNQFLK